MFHFLFFYINFCSLYFFTKSSFVQRSLGRNNWTSTCSSYDGLKLAAVSYSNSIGYIYTSLDSANTWVQRTNISRQWSSIKCSSNGESIAAVAGTNYIYLSFDSGVSWNESLVASSKNFEHFAISSNGSKIVVGGLNTEIYTSTNYGNTWVKRTMFTKVWTSFASSSDGVNLVGVTGGRWNAADYIFTSSDSGVTWTQRDSQRKWQSVTSSSDGVKLTAVVYGGYIYRSVNSGINWYQIGNSGNWYSIASSSNGNIITAVNNMQGVYISTDGSDWQIAFNSSRDWRSIALSSDGNKIVATEYNGYIYTDQYIDIEFETFASTWASNLVDKNLVIIYGYGSYSSAIETSGFLEVVGLYNGNNKIYSSTWISDTIVNGALGECLIIDAGTQSFDKILVYTYLTFFNNDLDMRIGVYKKGSLVKVWTFASIIPSGTFYDYTYTFTGFSFTSAPSGSVPTSSSPTSSSPSSSRPSSSQPSSSRPNIYKDFLFIDL